MTMPLSQPIMILSPITNEPVYLVCISQLSQSFGDPVPTCLKALLASNSEWPYIYENELSWQSYALNILSLYRFNLCICQELLATVLSVVNSVPTFLQSGLHVDTDAQIYLAILTDLLLKATRKRWYFSYRQQIPRQKTINQNITENNMKYYLSRKAWQTDWLTGLYCCTKQYYFTYLK